MPKPVITIDLEATYGPQWEAVVSLVERCKTLTSVEATRLAAARDAEGYAVRYAARGAAGSAAWSAARYAALDAAGSAALDAAGSAAWYAVLYAARDDARYDARYAARDAALAVVTYDLASKSGLYLLSHRDLLLSPWVSVCGQPENIKNIKKS